MSPVTIAAIAAIAIIAIVVGSSTLQKLYAERTKLLREQRAREDYADSQNRRRAEYERDISYIAAVFDPLKLFH